MVTNFKLSDVLQYMKVNVESGFELKLVLRSVKHVFKLKIYFCSCNIL